MTKEEILNILKQACNFNGSFGAINKCPECKDMSKVEYLFNHYPKMSKLLESLPWEKVVKYPRCPQSWEYPSKDGHYLCMLDCDEHYITTNEFFNGHWTIYHETHIKWWMSWK